MYLEWKKLITLNLMVMSVASCTFILYLFFAENIYI